MNPKRTPVDDTQLQDTFLFLLNSAQGFALHKNINFKSESHIRTVIINNLQLLDLKACIKVRLSDISWYNF